MIKMAGALLIVSTTTLAGIEKAKRLRNHLRQMKYLQRILCLIQSEIRYSRSFLGEIFAQIGQNAEEPYKSWLLGVSERTNAFTGENFEIIWRDSIEKDLKTLDFSENELETLKSLGNQLGFADVKVQTRLIDLYLEHLERTIDDLHTEMKTKVRLYHCLGVMSGLLVSVLLL